MSAPEVRTPGGSRASAGQTTEDAAIICRDDDGGRKSFATLAAQLAIRGYSLHELACGGYLIARWDRTLHCSDLGGVRAFYGRLGA